jgi:putative membrane-bound dehydrogenase-like protein
MNSNPEQTAGSGARALHLRPRSAIGNLPAMLAKLSLLLMVNLSAHAALSTGDDYQPTNSQAPGEGPPPAAEVAAGWKLPEGFHATLFSSEPDVRQPIDMKIDDRGRVWVAEAYSYKEWKQTGQDRVIFFEDSNNDGIADNRKVFKSGFHHISSLEFGFGGVWVMDAPNLYFIPDANRDDVPDGEPQIVMDGWTTGAEHNLPSGLTWGPDGWLYGRHGILQRSTVGVPGTPADQRIPVEVGIWRLHPVTKRFEQVVNGSTNPWGLDWDENGEMFMSGNVNGHLWHVMPGGLYERMYGAGNVPYDFERLKMIAEKPHYVSNGDWKSEWSKEKQGRDTSSDLGGGHSHCGLMIYQGDNWPAAHRGHFFMNNTHGRRVNEEAVEPRGATYFSKHLGDIAKAGSLWFRGVTVVSGPDGGVFVSDWCDQGECHDDDGVHRTSGRIYKITYGQPATPDLKGGLDTWSEDELTKTIASPNDWYFRKARRVLQERVLAGRPYQGSTAAEALATTPVQKLRVLWIRTSTNAMPESDLTALLTNDNRHIRLWAARLLTDRQQGREAILALAQQETDLLVLGHLLGLASRWPLEMNAGLVGIIVQKPETKDPVLELLTWYAAEPLVGKIPARAAERLPLVASTKVRAFAARRFVSTMDLAESRAALGVILRHPDEETLQGIAAGLAGRSNVPKPDDWDTVRPALLAAFPSLATNIGLAFGDTTLIESLKKTAQDTSQPVESRQQALRALISNRAPGIELLITECLQQPSVRLEAIRGLQAGSITPLLPLWPSLTVPEKSAAVDVLVSRPDWAGLLLTELEKGLITRNDITLAQARTLSLLNDAALTEKLQKLWGKFTTTSDEKQAAIQQYKALLASSPRGDAVKGKLVYTRSCAVCHTLFDEGGKLGPNLTGGGRRDPDYILINLMDPNAVIPRDYQMTVVTLKDQQILVGTVPVEDEKTITLQTIADRRVIERTACEKIERQPLSFMPEGLLQQMTNEEFLDLMAYLGQ